MQIMQEFPTNKPNFPFKHIQDFNQTKHVAPYRPIIFTDDISLYFNFLSSVQNVLKESQTVVIDFWKFPLNKQDCYSCIIETDSNFPGEHLSTVFVHKQKMLINMKFMLAIIFNYS